MNEAFYTQFYDYVKYPTWWQRINPLTKFVFCLCVGIASFVSKSLWFALFVFAFCFVTLISIRRMKSVGLLLILLIGLPGIISAVVRIVSHLNDGGAVAFTLFGTPIPVSALRSALDYFLTMGGFLFIMLTYFAGMDMRDICYCLENQLNVMPTFTFMTLSAISSVTSIASSLNTVRESQASRGIETDGSWIVRAKAVLPTLFPVIIASFTAIENKTLAMDARAFAVKGKHSALRRIRPPVFTDHIWAIMGVVILVATILIKILG